MSDEVRGVVELEITPLDPYYYVSRESGKTFSTKPYIMHTALYYALGLLPTRFRVAEQRPRYEEHFEQARGTDGSYIYPAAVIGEEGFTTRRFSVKGDAYRTEPVQENKNLVETGHQRFMNPDVSFRTFVLCRGDRCTASLEDRIPPYVRVGKKMTPASVRTAVHDVSVRYGDFDLGQPIGRSDLDPDNYVFKGNIRTEPMAPIDLITACEFEGPHVRVTPEFNPTRGEAVALPTGLSFLGIAG